MLECPATPAPSPPMSFSGPLWHVPHVRTGAEFEVADTIMDELSFRVFVPREQVWTVRRGIKVKSVRPVLPGYIFVEVDPYRQDWQLILDIDGVIDVLGAMADHDVPGYIMPAAWIAAWQKMEAIGEFDKTSKLPNDFTVGEMVRISDGPFAGHEALITEFMAKMKSATARKRAKLAANFFGRMTTLDLPVTSLEKL
jgi:transcriptional antiterminator RfaH